MRPRHLATPLLALSFLCGTARAENPPATAAWDEASQSLFKEANLAFRVLPPADREARLGEAVTLLNLQPKTDGNLDRAEALLRGLVAADADDGIGIDARYFLARIPQIHRLPADPAEARRRYRELIAARSDRPLAQRAIVNLAILDLYAVVPPEERRTRF